MNGRKSVQKDISELRHELSNSSRGREVEKWGGGGVVVVGKDGTPLAFCVSSISSSSSSSVRFERIC